MTILLVTEDLAIQRRFTSVLKLGGDVPLRVCTTIQEAETLLPRITDLQVLAVDFGTPGLGGLKAITRLIKARANARVVLLMHTPSLTIARQALRLGVTACIPAFLSNADLKAALSLAKGHNDLIVLPQGSMLKPDKENLLSRREEQILALLCDGQQNKEIAHTFGIQEVTVKMHMRSVIRKLGARNRTHAAMIARDRGMV
ncbi:two component transcriptional regulator, LuxR family [Aliiroseovarius sediminilitoris]|uniref:Two component transcriptional regulator, LuxR family n=1 Tax=Aliiroseovarius sediminilitoris TaxID=1173584 RepID=A0A1I0NKM0_9RHOB|nr:response regulator transcription factor [Aliiroseovarius sediminilitoris]SEW01811.1 two component transcriptional regulator, LuxR family [Aliiroseovarius sediminilitoris]